MKTGKAAVLVKPHQLETWDVPVPDPQDGGVLVCVVVGGVCGSDVHITNGDAGTMPFPIVLGHEGIGRVEKIGKGLDKDYCGTPIKQGDLIYWVPFKLCHRCYSCTVLEAVPCENSAFFEDAHKPNWGSYAEYACLPPGMAFYRLPENGSVDAVAALGCALPTVIGGLDRAGNIRAGESVLIQGAGPVGLSAVLLASLTGARHIIVLDGSDLRLDVARRLGATATISLRGSADERLRQVQDIVGLAGPDLVIEAAGATQAFSEGLSLVGHHGRYVVLGIWGQLRSQTIQPALFANKNISLHGYTFSKPKHYHRALRVACDNQERFGLASLITHRFGIREATSALEAVQSGSAVKAIIDPALA
ncbi:alcohol dehydrogenase [Variovorax sp. WS11]|uniref:zinc-binding dehydrogenase n=1 Tax=Variovorax sp. WS11 TaxID=1105204 RepID=UPI000D0DA7DC|nr:zinc-binding dehydrogenase [Variovorax sp. WS11]NDZ17737.1 alcohol dehydrogenase catalytic domain-containing protein [Variovorax sp. WS11]PSL80460.1 alcohol dehydrogenase [Variovorax sp. WS11]